MRTTTQTDTGLSVAVWETVAVGAYKNIDSYRSELQKAGYRINAWADEMLGSCKLTCVARKEIDLEVMSVRALGFTDDAHYQDIVTRAVQLGLNLCHAEVAPALRLHYTDQAEGELLHIATKPIIGEDGGHYIFTIGNSRGYRWLSWAQGDFRSLFRADQYLVFARH